MTSVKVEYSKNSASFTIYKISVKEEEEEEEEEEKERHQSNEKNAREVNVESTAVVRFESAEIADAQG